MARGFLAGTLFTLPWVGVGVGKLVSGRDLGFGLQPAWPLLALTVSLALLADRDREQPALPRTWRLAALAGSAAVALSALGLVLAPVQESVGETFGRYLRQVVQLGLMVGFLVFAAWWVRGERRWRFVARCLVVGAWFQLAYAGLQYLQWHQPGPLLPALERVFTSNPAILAGSEQLHVGDGFRDMPRLRGTMCEPLYLGNYLLAVLPLVGLTRWPRAVTGASFAALGVVLLLTWSRGAWAAGLGAGAIALALTRGRPRVPRRGVVLGVLATATVLAVALGPERLVLPWDRVTQSLSTKDWSNLTRLYSVQVAWRAFQLSPVVGIGWGQFAWHFPVLVDPMGLQSQFTWPVVNSYPLRVLCETGLAGFGVFVAVTAGLVRATASRVRRAPVAATVRLRACAVATAGVWLQLAIFSQYNLPHIWFVTGLLLATLREPAEEAS